MSRSYKRHPGGGHTVAESDKPYKTAEHRRERRKAAAALARGEEPPEDNYGDPCKSPKDGKQYWRTHNAKWMRK
jgi:hypothetical protein